LQGRDAPFARPAATADEIPGRGHGRLHRCRTSGHSSDQGRSLHAPSRHLLGYPRRILDRDSVMSHARTRRPPAACFYAGLFPLFLLLAGCATGPKIFVNEAPDVDLSQYATYGFVDRPDTDAGDYASLLTLYLQRAVAAELDERG